jgi:CRP-like cAMP-binding protein/DNA-binding NarL/FixJ family response regulator
MNAEWKHNGERKHGVLVVEDEAIVAMHIQETLEGFGYQVAGAVDSGEEAVRLAAQAHPDLVLMDIMLKGKMDGITAAGLIKERQNIPVVFLTAFADEGTLSRAKIAEPYGYVLKPFEDAELRAVVELGLHKFALDRQRSGATDRRPKEPSGLSLEPGAEANAREILRRHYFFSELPEQSLEMILRSCERRQLVAGEIITCEGDEEPVCFMVLRGRVAMVKSSLSGKELIVELVPPGDIYGITSIIEEMPAQLTARAQCPSDILRFSRKLLLMIFQENPKLYRTFAEKISERLRASHDLSRRLAHERVEVRIAGALLRMIPQFSQPNGRGEGFPIPITRQELADLTGTTPETAIRCTKAMEREKRLDLSRPGLIRVLDVPGLEELSQES